MKQVIHSAKILLNWAAATSSRESVCGVWVRGKSGHSIALPGRKVGCPDCLLVLKCNHNFKFLYEGRHGSDKGDSFYKCELCSLGVQIDMDHNKEPKEVLKKDKIPKIFDECSYDQASAIIKKGFEMI